MRAPYRWDKPRLYLHLSFASCIIIQLLTSLAMHRPYLGRKLTALQAGTFVIHSYSGLAATLTQELPKWVILVKEIHGTVAPLVWWYVGGHGGMASLHWLLNLLTIKFKR